MYLDNWKADKSQSLWNRAVSYDVQSYLLLVHLLGLNPFGTGQCLTTSVTSSVSAVGLGPNPFGTGQCLTTVELIALQHQHHPSQSLWNRAVSYDLLSRSIIWQSKSLNPFGTGQCLTTSQNRSQRGHLRSLNPFGTGQCLTTTWKAFRVNLNNESQSLWNRAVSYDSREFSRCYLNSWSQSLWNRAVSYD